MNTPATSCSRTSRVSLIAADYYPDLATGQTSNPASGVTASTTPSAALRNLDIGSFNQVEFKGNRTSTVDELSVGMDWSHL